MNAKQLSISIVALKIGIALLLTGCDSASSPDSAALNTVQTAGPTGFPIPNPSATPVPQCGYSAVGTFVNNATGDRVVISSTPQGECAISVQCGSYTLTGFVSLNPYNGYNAVFNLDSQVQAALVACGYPAVYGNLDGHSGSLQMIGLAETNGQWLGYVTPNEVNTSGGNLWGKQ